MAQAKMRAVTPIRVGPEHSPYETVAARSELARRLRTLPNDFVACRDIQHAWDAADGFFLEEVRGGRQRIVRRLSCTRCGTMRLDHHRIVDGGLQKTRSVYTYPEGFLLPKLPPGTKPLSVVRAESLRRALGIIIETEGKPPQ